MPMLLRVSNLCVSLLISASLRSISCSHFTKTMNRLCRTVLVVLAALPSFAHAQPRATAYDTTLFRAMQWRNIGPFRGGRSVAVAGVTSQPHTYYAGYTGGG